MTPLEDACSLSGNLPSGVFKAIGTYKWTDGDVLTETVDDGIYYPISFVVWHETAQQIRETLK